MGQQDQQHHQAGRPIKVDIALDLNWLIQSQPFMSATPDVPQVMPQVMPQDAGNGPNTSPVFVRTYPAQPAYCLGKHFEDCVDCLFAASSKNNIIARNLVIQKPERTLGELDLLYQNSAYLFQLAVSYY